MGILLGLLSALCWGSADFLVRYSTRMIGTYRTLFFMQFIGLFLLSLYLLFTGELVHAIIENTWQPWACACLVALLSMLGSLALYRAFEVGILTIVSPITSSYAALTVALSLLGGERIGWLHAVGIGTVLLGVIFVATVFTRRSKQDKEQRAKRRMHVPRGVGWAILAAGSFGVAFWLLGFYVTPRLGGIIPSWLIRLETPLVLALCAPLLKQSLKLPRWPVWRYLVAISLLDTAAFVTYSFGLTQGQIAIVSVLSSLYSAVTVLLAWIFIREQLQWSQWFGIGVVFAGIVLVNI
jgi:drug/metabolite transporter (DMT)-like permease